MQKFADYTNPVHFYEIECKRIAEKCNATLRTDHSGFLVSHPSFEGLRQFESIDTLYAFLVGLNIGYNNPKPTPTHHYTDNEMVIGYLLCITDNFQTIATLNGNFICDEHYRYNEVIKNLHQNHKEFFPTKDQVIKRLNDMRNNPANALEDQLLLG